MEHYMPIAEYQRNGFDIIVDIADEFLDITDELADCYTEDELADILDRVQVGELEWIILRARALVDDIELGLGYTGCLLYDNANKVLTDGAAESVISKAIAAARIKVPELMIRLNQLELS